MAVRRRGTGCCGGGDASGRAGGDADLRGCWKRAKTDRADARHQRDLLLAGRLPTCWIPPAEVLEARALLGCFHELRRDRTAWVQRIHAVPRGCAPTDTALARAAATNRFHAVKVVTDALDSEHGETWNEPRAADDTDATRKFKGARWVLLQSRARAGSGACPPRELRAGAHPAVTFPGGEILSVRVSRGDSSAEGPGGLSGGLSRRGRHALGEAARGRLGDRSGR
jgi:hypothetical protein